MFRELRNFCKHMLMNMTVERLLSFADNYLILQFFRKVQYRLLVSTRSVSHTIRIYSFSYLSGSFGSCQERNSCL